MFFRYLPSPRRPAGSDIGAGEQRNRKSARTSSYWTSNSGSGSGGGHVFSSFRSSWCHMVLAEGKSALYQLADRRGPWRVLLQDASQSGSVQVLVERNYAARDRMQE